MTQHLTLKLISNTIFNHNVKTRNVTWLETMKRNNKINVFLDSKEKFKLMLGVINAQTLTYFTHG